MTAQHAEWKRQYLDESVVTVQSLQNKLNIAVLTQQRVDRRRETLKSSFKVDLLEMFTEIYNWKKTSTLFSIPEIPNNFYEKHHNQQAVLREYVMLVVRAYNKIKESMDSKHTVLMSQHMAFLDS